MVAAPAAPLPASAHARFREVFDQAPISMQLFGTDGKTLQVNRAWEALWQGTFGPGLKDFVLAGGYNLLTDPQLQEKGVTPYLLRAVAGESVQIPAILYDPTELGIEARPRWVTAVAHPVKDDAGRVVEVVLMHEDITERLRAEEAVRISEERFRSLVTATTQMVWTSAPDGSIVADSPSWRCYTGQSYDEFKGDGWLGAVHPDDRERAAQAWTASVAARAVYEIEYRVRRADGAWRWTAVRAVPLLNAVGSIREWIGSNSDIHDIKSAYASLQEQHRRKDEFLAMLAHELRNPLAPIRAAADLLSFANVSAATVRQTSTVISRQVQHMSGLVDDLLDVSRVTRGLIELASVDLDIKRVVADALEQVRPLIETKRHELSVTMTAEPAHVLGDHKRLVQILTNILNNAAKYTPRGGAIHVRTEATPGQVVLTVQDNGIGIAPALQPHVFDLFAQAERSSDRSQGGLGIGLALVKSLVGLHGGAVACYSDGAGQGSQFVVTLPRRDSAADSAPGDGAVEHPVAARGRHVLVVDDNVDAAQMLAMYLEASGHVVAIEHSAQQALERALRDRLDVCILDIGLPDMDGHTLARKLRGRHETAGALLIALTGYGSDIDEANAMAAGFDHHLVKPVDSASLAAYLSAGPVGGKPT